MRVLVIDDEPALRRVIRGMLESAGHQVVDAENGRTGLETLRTAPFDVLVTDILMPEKEGIGTIAEARKLNKTVRIVASRASGPRCASTCRSARPPRWRSPDPWKRPRP